MRAPLAVLLLASIAGCGYFGTGTWDDDPKNWGRAFESPLPEDTAVLHSRYTRLAHLSNDHQYFFQLASSTALSRQLAADTTLVRLPARDADWTRTVDAPEWFAPKPPHAYDVYALAAEPGREFRILVDRSSREVFLTDRLQRL